MEYSKGLARNKELTEEAEQLQIKLAETVGTVEEREVKIKQLQADLDDRVVAFENALETRAQLDTQISMLKDQLLTEINARDLLEKAKEEADSKVMPLSTV